MRARRSLYALLGALCALFVALPATTNSSTNSSRVAITTHAVAHKPHASRRTVPITVAVLAAVAGLAALAVQRIGDSTGPTSFRVVPVVLASRGPPRTLLYG